MPVENGTNLGPYEVISPIGAGGMGEVYLARDVRLGRSVALKLLSAGVTRNEDRVRRFQQEARAASALNHPNIITIYEVGQVDSVHFIATEYIEGETLRQRMSRSALALVEVLDVGIQVSTALAAAHTAGIMHRDIKPENIMLRPDGYVKVLDFGLAKLTETSLGDPVVSSSDPDAKTQPVVNTDPGTVMGTVTYMSPEQARGQAVDARTDIFSLGVVLYEMIAGRVPFDGGTISEVIVSILKKRPLPLARYSSDVHPEIERIVNKALGKRPDERYQTVKDLLIDLKKLKQRLELEEELGYSAYSDMSLRDLSLRDPAPVASGSNTQARFSSSPNSTDKTEELHSVLRSTSSAEYIITEIKRHKKGAVLGLAALVFLASGIAYFAAGGSAIDTIAVMPIVAEGGDPNAIEIGNVITQRIINGLSRVPNLKVKSYVAVSGYAGRSVDPRAAGRDLDVKALVIGRVTKRERDDNLTISLELVNAGDSSQIWGEQYDRKFADLRQVQDEILRSISERLGVKLTDEEKRRREAEALYAEARNFWEKRTSDGIRRAVDSFQQAIQIRPDYALAYAGLADCYNMLATYGAERPKIAFPKAREAAERALELARTLAEAHTSLAFVSYRGDWRWEDADIGFQRAIRLNPNYAQAHQWYANYLAALGRHAEAEEETKICLRLDPTSLIVQSHFGFVYFFARRYDDVISSCQKTLDLDPNFFAARRYLGLAYTQKGMHEEAIKQYRQALSTSRGSALMRAELAYALASSTNKAEKDEARQILNELLAAAGQRYLSQYHVALIYTALDERELAFEALEKAYDDRADYLAYLKVDPRFDSIRTDPRFASLQQRLGL